MDVPAISNMDEFQVLLRLSGFEDDLLNLADSFRGHVINDSLTYLVYQRYKDLIETFDQIKLQYEIKVELIDILRVQVRVIPENVSVAVMPNWLQYDITYA